MDVTTSAPRLDARLVRHLYTLARTDRTFAEIRRELTGLAVELRVPPPSYEHVRRLVTLERLDLEAARESAILPVVVDVMLGREHGNELLRVARGGRRRPRAL
jgi:hypothetical protein